MRTALGGLLIGALVVGAPATRADGLPVETVRRKGLRWLAGQDDPSQTGIRPIAGRTQLLVSFAVPPRDPLAPFLRGRSFTYDNAVAALAFLANGRILDARRVLTALANVVTPQGTLSFSYRVDQTRADDPRVRTGTLAVVGYAMALHQRLTGRRQFQPVAERIAVFLQTLEVPAGSLRGGPDVPWVSTEHNVDAYFFFRELGRVTGQPGYQATAERIKTSLLTRHWVTNPDGGHFLRGIGDPTPALDANTLGAMLLAAIGRPELALQAIGYVERTFATAQTLPGGALVAGYAPDGRRGTVWWEGTLEAAVAAQRLGQGLRVSAIYANVAIVRAAWQVQRRWRGALPYATPRYVDPDGDTFADLDSVAATSWLTMSAALATGRAGRLFDRDDPAT